MIGRFVAYICEFETIVSLDARSFMSRNTRYCTTVFVGNFWNLSRLSFVRGGTREECVEK